MVSGAEPGFRVGGLQMHINQSHEILRKWLFFLNFKLVGESIFHFYERYTILNICLHLIVTVLK